MNILIIDDHPLVALPLQDRLTANGHTVNVAASLQDGLSAFKQEDYSLCLLDLDLPDQRGTEIFSNLSTEERQHACFALLSGTSDGDEIMIAMDAGASAYISKACSFDGLIHAIEHVVPAAEKNGGPVIWRDETEDFIAMEDAYPRGTLLSAREREVFQLLRDGLQDKQIAHQLGRSVHTIRIQIRSIKRKRGATRRAEAWK